MSQFIFLDSGPLSLLTQRRGVPAADACRQWLFAQLAKGAHFYVPGIVDYELRRELLRAAKSAAIARLDAFSAATPTRYVPLTTASIRLAAQLWADLRNRGQPTSHPEDLDVDVILAAQTLNAGFPAREVIVATTNPAHLSRLVTADLWSNIK